MIDTDERLWRTRRLVRDRIYELIPAQEINVQLQRDRQALRRRLDREVEEILRVENILLLSSEAAQLRAYVRDEVTGYGPIDPLLRDPTVEEVMVNGPKRVWTVRRTPRGTEMQLTDITFEHDDHVRRVIERIFSHVGRRVDESWPMENGRILLENGETARVNAIIPPLALDGPTMTVRMHRNETFTLDILVSRGSVTAEAAEFLAACVLGRLNVLVSGGTGSGKTTLLDTLARVIPDDERIITIEDSAELRLDKPHVVRLESRPRNIEGRGEVTIRELLINALRMRPDRIIVGEVRGGEALDMLQAMNTGHDGSLSTVHANDPHEVIFRLETMVLQGGVSLPSRAIRQQIAGAVDVIVQQTRLTNGRRRITSIAEVAGIQDEDVIVKEVYSVGDDVAGPLEWTGYVPRLVSDPRIAAYRAQLPAAFASYRPAAYAATT